MGCLHNGRQATGKNHQATAGGSGFDVLITQTHSARDARTAALVTWLEGVCRYGGMNAFFEEKISASPCLKPNERRRLRTAFDSARCILAAVVSNALDEGANLQLTNEVMWAEQHNKPIVILYDSGLPFKRHDWEERWPDIFRCGSVFRYYGKGHETCRKELLDTLEGILRPSDDKNKMLGKTTSTNALVIASKPSDGNETLVATSLEGISEKRETENLLSLEMAIETLQAMQDSNPTTEDAGSRKTGILRQKVGSTTTPAPRIKTPFKPTEENVQLAVKSIVSVINGPGIDIHIALDCLKASISVSEYLICACLRALCTHASLSQLAAEDLKEILDCSLMAMRQHSNSADVCTSVMQLLATFANSLPQGWPSVREATDIAHALRTFPSCQALQEFGFAFLAQVLGNERHSSTAPNGKQKTHLEMISDGADHKSAFAIRGGGLARILTRLGLLDVALTVLRRYRDIDALIVNICMVLNSLAEASREVKLHLTTSDIWIDILTHARLDAGSAVAALRTMASIVTDDIDAKDSLGGKVGILEILEHRLFEFSTAASAKAMGEHAEIFGFLCRLTARHSFNKNRCLKSELPRQAVECCMDRDKSDAARLAAGGFLVNLCGEKTSRQDLLAIGATRAAAVLQIASADLSRCGKMLDAQLNSAAATAEENVGPTRDPFDRLFAVRGEALRQTSNAVDICKKTSEKHVNKQGRERNLGEMRGPGWQRRPPKQLGVERASQCMDDIRDDISIMSQRSARSNDVTDFVEDLELAGQSDQKEWQDIDPQQKASSPAKVDAILNSSPDCSESHSRSDVYFQSRGLKGNSDMKNRLANVRKQAKTEEPDVSSNRKGLLSRFGRQSDTPNAESDRAESFSFRPEDREHEKHVAKLAVVASVLG